MPFGTGGVHARLTRGATMSDCISGWHKWVDSVVTYIDNHFEGDGSDDNTPITTISGTTLHVLSGYYQSRPGKPAFVIDDAASTRGSELTPDAAVDTTSGWTPRATPSTDR